MEKKVCFGNFLWIQLKFNPIDDFQTLILLRMAMPDSPLGLLEQKDTTIANTSQKYTSLTELLRNETDGGGKIGIYLLKK